MYVRIVLAMCLLLCSFSLCAFASAPDGEGRTVCQQVGWQGTYLRGVEIGGKHFAEQLQFNNGGAVTYSGTYYPEQMISSGTSTASVGTWECRKDGSIAATLFFANYSGDGNDLTVTFHIRATMIFTFLDDGSIRRDVMAVRAYFEDSDPTDPQGGFIVNLPQSQPEYSKLGVNLADLDL